MLSMLTDFLHTLYACGALAPEPLPDDFIAAFRAFVESFNAFLMLPTSHLDTIGTLHPFLWTAELHQYLLDDFDGDAVVAQYTQGDLPPSMWGPGVWRLLHALAERGTSDAVAAALNSCTITLPCPDCRTHLRLFLDAEPVPETNVPGYVIALHNRVNALIGKPTFQSEVP